MILPITVSTPAFTKTSRMSVIHLRSLMCVVMYQSLAAVVWLQPKNQLVPMIMRDSDSPPTIVLGKRSLMFYALAGACGLIVDLERVS